MTKTLFTLVIVGLLSCPAGFVLAQESAPATEEVPAAGGQDTLETTDTADSAVVAATVDPADKIRFRWGISGAGGPMVGGYTGGAGGLDLRFGAQITNMFGVYIQPILLVGAGVSASLDGGSASAAGLAGASVMADATFLDMFYVAAGPEFLTGGAGSAGASTTDVTASADEGPFFSLAMRAGIALGSRTPERRKAFTLGLDMHVVFTNDVTVLPLIALGYEMF